MKKNKKNKNNSVVLDNVKKNFVKPKKNDKTW